jgi:uncharacterized protein
MMDTPHFTLKPMVKTRVALAILLVLICTGAMFVAMTVLRTGTLFQPTHNAYLDLQASYQLLLLGIVALSLGGTFALDAEGFKRYFRLGDPGARGEAVPLFGIKQGDSWWKTGISLSVVITVATGLFMYFQLPGDALPAGWWVVMPWVWLFAASNAFGEEVVFRLGLVAPLAGMVKPGTVMLLSAVLFGAPHYGGMPGGLLGAVMAGVLGYVLARSIFDTRGMFWAWWIHFLQDVVIMTTLAVIAMGGGA